MAAGTGCCELREFILFLSETRQWRSDLKECNQKYPNAVKIIRACERIFHDENAIGNKEVVDFALEIKVFNSADGKKYHGILSKTGELSSKEKFNVHLLNQKLLYKLILTVQGAYQRLTNSPMIITPGPKLIKFAEETSVISKAECAHYMKNWLKIPGVYEQSLNTKILGGLKVVMQRTQPRSLN